MESRASVPPGLPRESPTKSYWQDPPDEIANLRSTVNLPKTADIVIIGSGVSGSSIANNLLEVNPGSNIMLLEARQAASGASGRNGGHTKTASYRSFLGNMDAVGKEDAIKIARLEYNCMVAVHDFCKQEGIQCDNKRCDTVDVFYHQGQLDQAQRSVDLMRKFMGSSDPAAGYKFWTPEETATNFLSPRSLGSLMYDAGSLSAYKFTMGILKLALKKGLNLQTNTPVKCITKVKADGEAAHWLVTTDRGTVIAKTLVLATNGYTAHLYPPLQGMIVPFRGIVTAHRPGTNLPQTGLSTTYSYIYEKGYEYMITRPAGSKHAGDIVIGGGLTKAPGDGIDEYGQTDDTVLQDDIVDYLTKSTVEFFGKENWGSDHSSGRVRHAWSGVMGYSADGYPLVGVVPGEDGLFVDASFQGHGMVLCFLCAKAATAMILGTEVEAKLDDWFPKCYRVSKERMRLKFKGRLHHDAPRAVEGTRNGVK